MKFLTGLATLASLAVAAPLARAPSPLEVKLEMVGNSEVKATVTNTGSNSLKLLKTGTLLGDVPTKKVAVSSESKPLEFDGIKLYIAHNQLKDENFQTIEASESVQVTFDIAQLYDLSEGGTFKIASEGVLAFAEENDTELIGSVPFFAEEIEAEINGDEAVHSRTAFRQKRAILTECTGSRLTTAQTALSNCAMYARGAQTAAASGPAAKVEEYYKSSSSATRNEVAAVFGRIVSECSSSTSGFSRFYCSDPYNYCSGATAYTVPWESYTAYCDGWFNYPAITRTCHAADQASIALHEMTHLTQIKGTDDYSCYGYQCVRSLTAAQNINHADTYLNFANAIYVGC